MIRKIFKILAAIVGVALALLGLLLVLDGDSSLYIVGIPSLLIGAASLFVGLRKSPEVTQQRQQDRRRGPNPIDEWDRKVKERDAAAKAEHERRKNIIRENIRNGVPCCPYCGSTYLTANKRGYSAGKGAAGFFFFGGLGLALGGSGSNKVLVTCMSCGRQFPAGKKPLWFLWE